MDIKTAEYDLEKKALTITLTAECHLDEVPTLVSGLKLMLDATEQPMPETEPAAVAEEPVVEPEPTTLEMVPEEPAVEEPEPEVQQEKPALGEEASVDLFNGELVLSREPSKKSDGEVLLLDSGHKVLVDAEGNEVKRAEAKLDQIASARKAHSKRWKKGMHWYGGRKITDASVVSDWNVSLTLEDGVQLMVSPKDEVLSRYRETPQDAGPAEDPEEPKKKPKKRSTKKKKSGIDPDKTRAAFDEKDKQEAAKEEPPPEEEPVVGDLLTEAKKMKTLQDIVRIVAQELGPDKEIVVEWCRDNSASVPLLGRVPEPKLEGRVGRMLNMVV